MGIYLEITVGLLNYHKYQSWLPVDDDNQQHMTMYMPFLFGSIIEIAQFYGANLPEKSDYALGFVAFFVEGVLFSFHLHTKELANAYLHVLLLVAIFGCVVFTLLEACNERSILLVYGRILFTGLQGLWLCHMAFITDPVFKALAYDLKDMSAVKMFAVYYCWYIVAILVSFVVILLILKWLYFQESDYFRSMYNELIYHDASARNFKLIYFDATESAMSKSSSLLRGSSSCLDEEAGLLSHHPQLINILKQ
jgi:hypothetical protein